MEEKQKKGKLNLINEIEIIKSRLEVGSQFPISVTDNEGNKVIFRNEDTSYPFISDNVFVVHNYLFYGLFTLDKNEDGVFPSYFIKAYGEGFKEGIKFLEKEKIDISNLDDKNRKENLIERLKRILHQRKMKNNKTIIDLVVGSVQLIWTEKNLFEAGKYKGIITAIDQFAERAGLDEKDLGKETAIVDKIKKDSKRKIGHKYYALLYWMELNANGDRPPMTFEGEFKRDEIEAMGRTKGCGKGQQFYREFRNIKEDLNNQTNLINKFGKEWKETVITLSNNDPKTIDYIAKQYPE